MLLPALKPDVALLHAPMADRFGNVWIGRHREMATMAHAAEKTVVTVEKIIDGNLLDDPVMAAGHAAGLLCRGDRGGRSAAPGRCRCRIITAPTTAHLALYAKMAATPEGFAEYLDKYVYEKEEA